MKTFSTFLTEALTPKQQEIVDKWTPDPIPGKQLSEHVFKGESVLTYPLESTNRTGAEIHPDVKSHLEKHGYKIASTSDYKAGYAVDKHSRMVSIGKALSRTKADPETVSKFVNDPARATQSSGLSVAYTWHPHHVAGMSTDRGWSSCMDMNKAENKHYIEDDIRQGTHTAYLIHSHDKDIENPLARINLKPFSSVDGHTVLVPTLFSKKYGAHSTAFEKHVAEWADTHFPMRENVTYRRNYGLYDEGPDSMKHMTNETIKGIVHKHFNGEQLAGMLEFGHGMQHPGNIDTAVNETLNLKEKDVLDPSNLKADKAYMLNKIVSQKDSTYHTSLEKIVDAMHSGEVHSSADLVHNMNAMAHRLSHEHARKLMDVIIDSGHRVNTIDNTTTIHHSGVTNEQIERGIKEGSFDHTEIPRHKITPDIVSDAMRNLYVGDPHRLVASPMIESKHFTEHHMSDLFDHVAANGGRYEHATLANRALTNPNYTIEHAREFDSRLERREHEPVGFAFRHKDADISDFEHAKENMKIGTEMLKNINSPVVSMAAFKDPSTQFSYLRSAYTHTPIPDTPVKQTIISAAGIPSGSEHIRSMIGESNPYLIGSPVYHQEAKKNILNAIRIHPNDDSDDKVNAVNKAARNAVDYDDHEFAHKIMATATIAHKDYEPIHFDKDIVDAVKNHHYDTSFVKIKE